MSQKLFDQALAEHEQAVAWVAGISGKIDQCANRLHQVLTQGGRVLICGNGGSAADAQHFAAELTGRFKLDRPAFAAIALTTDTSALTAIANDYGFEAVFSRQVEALGRAGDMLVVISTSGNSVNLLRAVEAARERGLYTVGILGRDGGALGGVVDLALTVEVDCTARVQEAHILILHLLCELFESKI